MIIKQLSPKCEARFGTKLSAKQKSTKQLMMLTFISFLASKALAGSWVSGGGDPLRFYFEEGQAIAVEMLRNLNPKDLPKSLSTSTKNWIESNTKTLIQDLEAVELDWITEGQPTCALTQYTRNAPITLSLETCRSISSKEEAAKLLLHEATHHLGVTHEDFSDDVAISVAAAWETLKIREVPVCNTQEHSEILHRLAGTWKLNPQLTLRLGGSGNGPKMMTLMPKLLEAKEFKGFGGCALQAGRLTFHLAAQHPERVISMPYLIVAREGALTLITPKPSKQPNRIGGLRKPPRFPLRDEHRAWYLSYTKAKEPASDILFLGDQDTDDEALEARRAFVRN